MYRLVLTSAVVLVLAIALRYLLPSSLGRGRFDLSIRVSPTEIHSLPLNVAAFWLVLGIGAVIVLIKLVIAPKRN